MSFGLVYSTPICPQTRRGVNVQRGEQNINTSQRSAQGSAHHGREERRGDPSGVNSSWKTPRAAGNPDTGTSTSMLATGIRRHLLGPRPASPFSVPIPSPESCGNSEFELVLWIMDFELWMMDFELKCLNFIIQNRTLDFEFWILNGLWIMISTFQG